MSCPKCGLPTDSGDRFCMICGALLADVHTQLRDTDCLARRIIAAILDFVVIWCVISMIVVLVPSRVLEEGFSRRGPATLIPIGLCTLGLLYYILFEAFFGATPGKAIAGIQVRSRDYEACSLRASLIRNLLRVVDGVAGYLVGLLVAVLSESRQRIGDLLAGTIVVRRPGKAITRVLLVLAWFVAVSSAFVACNVVRRR